METRKANRDGFHLVEKYMPFLDKTMRMHSVTAVIENGFVYLPEKAKWLDLYRHELVTFPNTKFDDQADPPSQALGWAKSDLSYVFGPSEKT